MSFLDRAKTLMFGAFDFLFNARTITWFVAFLIVVAGTSGAFTTGMAVLVAIIGFFMAYFLKLDEVAAKTTP